MLSSKSLFTNPFDSKVSDIIDFIDDMKIEKRYNTTYKIYYDGDHDATTALTPVAYTYLYHVTWRASNSLSSFIELFNETVHQYLGIRANRFEVVYYSLKGEIYTKLIPYLNDERIYMSHTMLSNYRIKYQDILSDIDNVLISNDPLSRYVSNDRLQRIDNIVYGKEPDDSIDMKITKLKQEDHFTLIEFRDDPIVIVMLELAKVFRFKIISDEHLVLQYANWEIFETSPKDWLVKNTFRLLDSDLPVIRIQTSNSLDNVDEYDSSLRAKIKLASILSYQRVYPHIDTNKIRVHYDLSVEVPVFSLDMLQAFNDYLSIYLSSEIDNWSAVLCPTLSQGITLRNILKSDTRLGVYNSYIVNNDDDDYLILLTPRSETIKVSNDLPDSDVDEDMRGYMVVTNDQDRLDISKSLKINQIKDCENKIIYYVKYNDQNLLITHDVNEVKRFEDKMGNIKSEWIRYYASEYGMMSSLIGFMD